MAILNNGDRDKLYNGLIRLIRGNNKIDKRYRGDFVDYLVAIKTNKKYNDFVDDDLLANVFYDISEMYEKGELDYSYKNEEDVFCFYKQAFKFIFPDGVDTPNYETLKKEVLNNCFGEEGLFRKELFNREFYALFENKTDYFQLMNMVSNDQDLIDYFDTIVEFATKMGKEIDDYNLFKRELVSFMHEVKNIIDDEDEYTKKRIKETRMRAGIYPGLDEKTASEISREVEKAHGILTKLEIMDEKVDEFKKEIDNKTKEGKEEIIRGLREYKKELLEELDKEKESLVDGMKQHAEIAVDEVVDLAQEKLKKIRFAINDLSSTTTKEIIRIRNEADESVEKLQRVAKDDGVREAIKYAKDNQVVMDNILAIQSKATPDQTATIVGAPNILISTDKEDFLVPDMKMTEGVLPAFDSSIPFDERMKLVEWNIEKMKEQGYLIPDTIFEALPWYIMGNKIVYLYGPAQSGKTTLAELIAKSVGSELIDGGKITEEHSVTSFNDVRGKFDENQLFHGLYLGKTVLYDEFDSDNPNNIVLLGTYTSQLANKIKHPERDVRTIFAKRRYVPINVNARIITCGNTAGKGKNKEYNARNKFDESTQQRIVPIYCGYNEDLEARIFQGKPHWLEFFKVFREGCISYATQSQKEETEGNLTTNDASTIVDIVDNNSMPISNVVRGLFVQVKEEDYLGHLINIMKEKYKVKEVDYNIEKLNNTPLKELTAKDIAQVFVYEAKNKNKGYVKRR